MLLFILVIAVFSALPLVLSIGMSLKPINELYLFPPTLWPRNATFDNYKMLFSLINSTRVAFSRYAFNTVFITIATTAIHVLIASMAAYPLSKGRFLGKNFLNQIVLLALMFVPAIADVINYQTIVSLGWLDTYMAAIAPNVATTLGAVPDYQLYVYHSGYFAGGSSYRWMFRFSNLLVHCYADLQTCMVDAYHHHVSEYLGADAYGIYLSGGYENPAICPDSDNHRRLYPCRCCPIRGCADADCTRDHFYL